MVRQKGLSQPQWWNWQTAESLAMKQNKNGAMLTAHEILDQSDWSQDCKSAKASTNERDIVIEEQDFEMIDRELEMYQLQRPYPHTQ